MSERLTNILGYLTLFAILGAIWVLFGEDPTRDQGGRGEPTFVGLKDSINDVAGLSLTTGDSKVTLEKADDAWTVAERNGYPADLAKVRDFLRGVALSERREPKTADPDRFEQIGLGGSGTAVSLRDAKGETMRAFAMGKQSTIGSDRSLTYVFQDSDTRSWLVTSLAEASADPAWWLKTDLLDIADSRVRSISLGGTVLSRTLNAEDYTIDGLKDGEEAVPSWQLNEPARVLTGLSFADVRHLGNPLAAPKRQVALVTHDGLRLMVTLYDMDDATWAQVSAIHDESLMSEGEAGLLPDAPVDGAAEADAINARTRGWFFKLADGDAEVLMRDRDAFVKAPVPAAS
ncbi:DUF4340 domain-containing protein [Kordiimonas lacus]|uniref:DUF4340 domain-containing protein n=1 Tax=Kordiimonas lacus TaxID=637679 RepID=A0A1G6ULA3_9PROT|nr:DUF4340 domain-containing protein [Kordiimonas lacus]SDD42034.1 protein of unknown function [Kordiimonas lacus]